MALSFSRRSAMSWLSSVAGRPVVWWDVLFWDMGAGRWRHKAWPKPAILVFCRGMPAAECQPAGIIQRMYLRAGVISLGLLLASRVLGLLRESVQAATFGTTGLADLVVMMLTLPDLASAILAAGALSYALLPCGPP
jgi:hypothetical protein